jgi:hypothetical protein
LAKNRPTWSTGRQDEYVYVKNLLSKLLHNFLRGKSSPKIWYSYTSPIVKTAQGKQSPNWRKFAQSPWRSFFVFACVDFQSSEVKVKVTVKRNSSKMRATFVIFKKLPKVNNRPLGDN